jgi:acyl-CoA hydrolase
MDAHAPDPTAPPAETRMTELVFPNQTNHMGTLFGGHALQMMDMSAAVAAHRHARTTMVTVATEDVHFEHPVHHGELVEVTARVVGTGNTSLVVHCDLVSEHLISGLRTLCATGRFVFVALGDDGRPTALPPLGRAPGTASSAPP